MDATVRVERYADQGRCVGHIDGRVVFIRFALPGELVTVSLDEPHNRDDRFWTGEVTEVLEASPERVTPPWPLAGPLAMGGGVGGADLIHVSLPGQLAWKASMVAEQMHRLGHVDVEVPVERMPGDEALGGLHWRTRIEMMAGEDGLPSMHRRGTHVRVPLTTMPLATNALLAVAEHTKVWEGGFKPGDQIRCAVPEPRSVDVSTPQTSSEEAWQAVDGNYAVLVNGKLHAGRNKLTERMSVDNKEFTYTVDARGFWQMHRMAPMALPQHVMGLVHEVLQGKPQATVWDLYSGSGLFTLPLATLAAPSTRVLSVEGSKLAVSSAHTNIREAGLRDVIDARCGDVAKTLSRDVPRALGRPDVVVLDPPRAGAKAKVCQQIAQSGAPAVIYIACDATSLARDTATLTKLGYSLADIRAFDIYPMTHHVETVALFRK